MPAATCAGGIGWSKRNSPVTAMFVTPTEAKRSACRSDFTSAPAKPRMSSARRPSRVVSRAKLFDGYCALHMNSGTPCRAGGEDHARPDLDLHDQPVLRAEGAEEAAVSPVEFEGHPDGARRGPAAMSGARTRSASRRPAG